MSNLLKYVLSVVFVSVVMIGLFVLCFVIQIDIERGLPFGSPIPEMSLTAYRGENVALNREQGLSIIIFFRNKCEHCLYQLNLLEENFTIFSNFKLYLLTDDAGFFRVRRYETWQNLSLAENVIFAFVNKKDFKNKFGSLVTPSTYIFNKDGILVSKIYGEVKLQRILVELSKTVYFYK